MALSTHLRRVTLVLVVGVMLPAALGAQKPATKAASPELSRYRTAEKLGRAHLAKFDTLDFDVYSNQRWDRFPESHAPDILVHYPDGHTTKGLEAHIAELKPLFVFAPDTHIKVHPVKITQGEWTSVIGLMEAPSPSPCPSAKARPLRRRARPSSS